MLRRTILWILSILLALPLVGFGGLYWLAKRAEPAYSGSLIMPGLNRPVNVRFGPHAVPSIEAENLQDLLFAQGYVVASERLWQMDLLRRLASGRLAELFGPDALPVDRFFRTVGLAGEARRALEGMEPSDRALLDAYASGVNAYLAGNRRPLEYRIAGLVPAPWHAEDSLAIGAYMAWTQSFNARGELTFLRLAQRLGPERARELFPTDEGLPAPEVAPELVRYLAGPDGARMGQVDVAAFDRMLALPGRLGLPIPGPASNAWLVTGSRTANGAAMLANDPHLALSMPGIWYELELIARGLHVAGVALPGVPLVLIGHNADLAWGFTTVIADTQDIFIERPTPDGHHVERAGGEPEPIQIRRERVLVRGGEPVEIAIRSTSRGVVLNEILGDTTGTLMDLPEPGLIDLLVLRQNHDRPDRSFQAVRGLAEATTLEEARTAGLDFRHVSTNLMLAHRDGGIAWQVTGLLPERGAGSGAFPSPGWIEAYAWQGHVPQALNPSSTNPAGDVLITANNRTIPSDHPVQVSRSWMSPHRAQRVAERIAKAPPLTPESMAAIQADRVSFQGRQMQASVRRLEPEIRDLDPRAWEIAATHLLDWDGTMDGASRPAAFAALLEPALFRALYADELGEDLPLLMSLVSVAYSPLQETLRSGDSSFWDDIGTPEVETPAAIWARAILAVWAELTARSGDADGVRLDQIRSLKFPHAFDAIPLLGRLFSVGPIAVGGSSDTIDIMKTLPQNPGEGLFAASMRFVATPSDWSQTRGTLPLGQSGHPFSPYRTDQLQDWLAVRGHPWPWNGPAEDETIGRLRLLPPEEGATP
ncbi:penicillin acylase family protein [Thiocystis violacea]|uniref:penicillin acylase family protein n=1 Tax=Thiocystis violacea TaxID=13725 RepID=UPI0019083C83|nr:penicillin acylase family protein [Thiocystis violacea]MBK1716257.1 penicillin acylase family protein [Thiocystis violacea]